MATLKTLALIGLLAILAGIAAAVYFFGGYYSVAGTAEDPAVVKWALTKGQSVSGSRKLLFVAIPKVVQTKALKSLTQVH